MNNDETYTPCTKCGRPMAYCKGECCGKPRGCQCQEYGPMTCGAIRPGEPKCPFKAVIPSLTVENVSNIKELADCFVHVSDINTTFYIDDKHRMMITWAGPVEVNNYDYENNPLGLRSQTVYDFANNRFIYYDKTGNYEVFETGADEDPPIRLRMEWSNTLIMWNDFRLSNTGVTLDYQDVVIGQSANKFMVKSFNITDDVVFVNEADESEELEASDVFALLEDGKEVILDNVPLGATRQYDRNEEITLSELPTPCDGIKLSGPGRGTTRDDWRVDYTSYAGSCVVTNEFYNTPMYVTIGMSVGEEGSGQDPEYYCLVHGFVSYSIGH